VIRQEGDIYDQHDPFIHLPIEHAKKLVTRLKAVIAEAEAESQHVAEVNKAIDAPVRGEA
jgi:hypothetical protein